MSSDKKWRIRTEESRGRRKVTTVSLLLGDGSLRRLSEFPSGAAGDERVRKRFWEEVDGVLDDLPFDAESGVELIMELSGLVPLPVVEPSSRPSALIPEYLRDPSPLSPFWRPRPREKKSRRRRRK